MYRLSRKEARELTTEQIEYAMSRRDTMSEVARLLGISTTRLYSICRGREIPTLRERANALAPEDIINESIYSDYENDTLIARRLGVSLAKMRSVCKDSSIPTPNELIRSVATKRLITNLVKACLSSETTKEAIEKVGVHQTYFHKRVKEFNIETPTQRKRRETKEMRGYTP